MDLAVKSILNLDCTLRDGGYYTNWDFADDLVETYYLGVAKIKTIDYIEIGYFSPKQVGSYRGQYYNLSSNEIKIAKQLSDKLIAVMINSKEWEINLFKELLSNEKLENVDLLRFAVDPKKIEDYIPLFKECESQGIEYALNFMYASKWENTKFCDVLVKESLNPEFIYVVDSFGGLLPDKLRNILSSLSNLNLRVGFHGHDNMTLAFANSLVAKELDVSIIDSTWLGMGRGAGNLSTENWITFLEETNYRSIIDIINMFKSLKSKYTWGSNLEYFVSGKQNFEQAKVMDMITSNVHGTEYVISQILSNERIDKVARYSPSIESTVGRVLIVGNGVKIQNTSPDILMKLFAHFDVIISIVNAPEINELIRSLSKLCIVVNQSEPGYRITDESGSHLDYSNEANECLNSLDYSLSLSLNLKCSKIFLYGVDGYGDLNSEFNRKQFLLNQEVLDYKRGLNLVSLTDTLYNGLIKQSLYNFIEHD